MTGEPWYIQIALSLAAFVGALALYLNNRGHNATLTAKVNTIATQSDTQAKAQQDTMAAQATAYTQSLNQITTLFERTLKFRDDQDKYQKIAFDDLQKDFIEFRTQADCDRQGLQTQIDAQCALMDRQTEQMTALQKSLNARTDELAKANDLIRQQAEQLTQLNDLQTRVETLEKQVHMLSTERDELIKQRDEALADVKAKNAVINRLTGQLSTAEQKLASAEAELLRVRATLPESKAGETGIFPDDPVGGRSEAKA